MSKVNKSKVSGETDEEVANMHATSSDEKSDAKKGIDKDLDCEKSSDLDNSAQKKDKNKSKGKKKGGTNSSNAGAADSNADSNSCSNSNSDSDSNEDEKQDISRALEAAQKEVAEWKDKYLRLHAEWDTYRRRTNEQRANEKALATEKLVNEILPVLDDFERTINYATENGEKGLLDGVHAVQTKLHGVLEKSGLVQLDPVGEPFDALQHQAVATIEDADAFDETVHEVYQKGYKMGSKVLRPAMVVVTTGGPARPASDDDSEEE